MKLDEIVKILKAEVFTKEIYNGDLEFKYSKAIVRVYFDNYQENAGRPDYTFTVPTDNNGKYWIVFEYYPTFAFRFAQL